MGTSHDFRLNASPAWERGYASGKAAQIKALQSIAAVRYDSAANWHVHMRMHGVTAQTRAFCIEYQQDAAALSYAARLLLGCAA